VAWSKFGSPGAMDACSIERSKRLRRAEV